MFQGVSCWTKVTWCVQSLTKARSAPLDSNMFRFSRGGCCFCTAAGVALCRKRVVGCGPYLGWCLSPSASSTAWTSHALPAPRCTSTTCAGSAPTTSAKPRSRPLRALCALGFRVIRAAMAIFLLPSVDFDKNRHPALIGKAEIAMNIEAKR